MMKERTVGRFSWPEDITTNCSKNTALSISQGTKRISLVCDGEQRRKLLWAKVSLCVETRNAMKRES